MLYSDASLPPLMTVAADLTSAASVINRLIFRCCVAASMQAWCAGIMKACVFSQHEQKVFVMHK